MQVLTPSLLPLLLPLLLPTLNSALNSAEESSLYSGDDAIIPEAEMEPLQPMLNGRFKIESISSSGVRGALTTPGLELKATDGRTLRWSNLGYRECPSPSCDFFISPVGDQRYRIEMAGPDGSRGALQVSGLGHGVGNGLHVRWFKNGYSSCVWPTCDFYIKSVAGGQVHMIQAAPTLDGFKGTLAVLNLESTTDGLPVKWFNGSYTECSPPACDFVFTQVGGQNELDCTQIVLLSYRHTLCREPDGKTYETTVQACKAGAPSAVSIKALSAFLRESEEYQDCSICLKRCGHQSHCSTLMEAMYKNVLCRNPMGTDLKPWVARCEAGQSVLKLEAALRATPEYTHCEQCQHNCGPRLDGHYKIDWVSPHANIYAITVQGLEKDSRNGRQISVKAGGYFVCPKPSCDFWVSVVGDGNYKIEAYGVDGTRGTLSLFQLGKGAPTLKWLSGGYRNCMRPRCDFHIVALSNGRFKIEAATVQVNGIRSALTVNSTKYGSTTLSLFDRG